MNLVLIEIIAAAVLVVVLVAVVVAVLGRTGRGRRGGRATDPAALAGPFAGARAVVDRSLGMYVLRHLAGRPTDRDPAPVERAKEGRGDEVGLARGVALAGAAEIARGDVHGRDPSAPAAVAAPVLTTATPTFETVATIEPYGAAESGGAAALVATGTALASKPPAPAAAPTPRTATVAAKASALSATRAHLVRDTGFALLVVGVVVVAAIGFWRGGPAPVGPSPAAIAALATDASPDPSLT